MYPAMMIFAEDASASIASLEIATRVHPVGKSIFALLPKYVILFVVLFAKVSYQ